MAIAIKANGYSGGTRKLHYLLQGQDDGGLKVGRDRLFRILAEHRLLLS
ncbi:hypothetical protein [Aeromonas veronii]